MHFKHWVFDGKTAVSGVMRYAGLVVKKLLPRSSGFHRRWANFHGTARERCSFGKNCSLWIQTAEHRELNTSSVSFSLNVVTSSNI